VTEAEQLLLWRWSTIVQVSSLTMVAGFFAILSRSNRRPELIWWTRAWTANLVALLVTSAFWLLQTDSFFALIAASYIAAKTAFTLMLAQGAWLMIRPGSPLLTSRAITLGIAVYAAAAGLLLPTINAVGIVQHLVIGVLLVALAIQLWIANSDAVTWLMTGIAVRGLLALFEAGAYFIQWQPPESGWLADLVIPAAGFLSASSSFDMGAEWLVVLGSVLAVSERGRHQLEASHHRLVLAQEDLRRLADRDPLTGATNRRAMRDVFSAVHPIGATLLFFDLDGFKAINDDHGHAVGDACLKMFAAALKDSFRPNDHVVRYGGDEFLVIAPGLDIAAARSRVEELTAQLDQHRVDNVYCGFSVGMSQLAPFGPPEVALQEADQNMYKAKNRARH
jgi:diguanylate cyclase (GGDEF)-like protein